MNIKINPNIEELKEMLLRFNDDECNHILWVSFNGLVHISKIPSMKSKREWEIKHKGIAKFYYSYVQGNGCVGKRAAFNEAYVKGLLSDLKKNWEEGSKGHITYLKLIKCK